MPSDKQEDTSSGRHTGWHTSRLVVLLFRVSTGLSLSHCLTSALLCNTNSFPSSLQHHILQSPLLRHRHFSVATLLSDLDFNKSSIHNYSNSDRQHLIVGTSTPKTTATSLTIDTSTRQHDKTNYLQRVSHTITQQPQLHHRVFSSHFSAPFPLLSAHTHKHIYNPHTNTLKNQRQRQHQHLPSPTRNLSLPTRRLQRPLPRPQFIQEGIQATSLQCHRCIRSRFRGPELVRNYNVV